jgi:hypothetical protein
MGKREWRARSKPAQARVARRLSMSQVSSRKTLLLAYLSVPSAFPPVGYEVSRLIRREGERAGEIGRGRSRQMRKEEWARGAGEGTGR